MILKVKLHNWKSHFNSELEFKEGVNVLVGEMGSGKSSVLDAISFALYGTTPALQSKTTKLDNLLRREPQKTNEAFVELFFKLGENVYSVKRTIKRKKGTTDAEIRKNGTLIESASSKKVTEEVEKLLKMDFDMFSRAVYSEQNNLDYFLNLRAGERKKKIDELLKLDRFSNARKNCITMFNKLKTLRESVSEELKRIQEDKDILNIPELEKEISVLETKLLNIDKFFRENSEKLEKAKIELRELNIKKENSRKLKEKFSQLQGQLERIKVMISQETEKNNIQIPQYSKRDIPNKISELENKLERIKNNKRKFDFIEKEIFQIETSLSHARKELETLEKNKEKFKNFEKITKELNELEIKKEEFKNKLNQNEIQIKELREHIFHLRKNNECPVCLSELSLSTKEKVISKKENLIKTLENENEVLSHNLKELEKSLSNLKTEWENLLQFKKVDEKIKEKEIEVEKSTKQIKELVENKEKLEKEISGVNEDDLVTVKRILELRLNEKEIVEKLEFVNNKLLEINFKEEVLEKKVNEKFHIEKQLEVARSEKLSINSLLNEKRKYLKLIKEKQEKLNELERKSKKYFELQDFLSKFADALEDTQVALRILFVDTVNMVVQDLWSQIYPYEDYNSLKLEASEDYALKLKSVGGNWVSVNGEVSGGERHSAALVLRIAFSLVLAPEMKILILDEPTHNLDMRAVRDLADTLKSRVSNLIDQLFVITHDEKLENAVTGNLYRFRKKGTESGLTEISMVD